jgi:3,4-dihydroxy 2-butanone 4-phosphate synthase/GTP cyclohydrolase II
MNHPSPTPISPVEDIVADLRAGRMVVLVDEEDRENEGDLVLAADHVSAEAINFMAKHGRGLICLTLTRERCERLALPPMVSRNGTKHATAFTVSIEAAEGVTTGISAADRAHTVATAVARDAKASDLVQPGHVFPLQAQDGGVLVRAGHTEAGCDLAAMAGCTPAAVICEIMKDDGSMARLPDLQVFAAEHGLKIGTIADLIEYRSRTESLVARKASRTLHTAWGSFDAVAWQDKVDGHVHLSLAHGLGVAQTDQTEVLVRVHEPLSVLDALETRVTTHSWSLPDTLAALQRVPHGVVVLLNAGESGADLLARLGTLADAEAVNTTTPARASGRHARSMDLRTYGVGMQILRELGIRRMKLMANPRKMPSMAGWGVEVTGFECPPAAAAPDARSPASAPLRRVS